MSITDEHVAALHAYLVGDLAEHDRLVATLAPIPLQQACDSLVPVALSLAAAKRFANRAKRTAEVIGFVAEVRATSDAVADTIEPRLGERLVLEASAPGEKPETGIRETDNGETENRETTEKQLRYQLLFLAALIGDAGLDGSEVDALLSSARRATERA